MEYYNLPLMERMNYADAVEQMIVDNKLQQRRESDEVKLRLLQVVYVALIAEKNKITALAPIVRPTYLQRMAEGYAA